jgi:hypothetical protein
MAQSTTFVKVIKGIFTGNLGNLWTLGKQEIKMVKPNAKKSIQDRWIFAARPMVTRATKDTPARLFGFESKLFMDNPIDEKLDTEPYLQFLHSAQSWIRGYVLTEDKQGNIEPEYHSKLNRAQKIQILDPHLRYQDKTDKNGTKYREYFLTVNNLSQVRPLRNLELEAPSMDSIFRKLSKSGHKPITA